MTRLFGTDGIRGAANLELRPSLAFSLGRATAHQLGGPGRSIVLGQDTRRSGDMFVAAITAGATSMGTEVHSVGVVPTPALAYLAGTGEFGAGIMVSASHNPAEDNGLKVLDPSGLKLDDDLEDELEALILRADELPGAPPAAIGSRTTPASCWSATSSIGARSPRRSRGPGSTSSSTPRTGPRTGSRRGSSRRPGPA